jgi:hypothetical protein
VPGVADSFVYGDSNQPHLVAIIVADKGFVMKFAATNNLEGTFEELCKNK